MENFCRGFFSQDSGPGSREFPQSKLKGQLTPSKMALSVSQLLAHSARPLRRRPLTELLPNESLCVREFSEQMSERAQPLSFPGTTGSAVPEIDRCEARVQAKLARFAARVERGKSVNFYHSSVGF